MRCSPPTSASTAEIAPLLELYREIGELAPLAIEEEWAQLVLNYETASTVVPGDDASIQAAAAQAYQSEQSAAAVKRWLIDNCALDIGPVATIVAAGRLSPGRVRGSRRDAGSPSRTGRSPWPLRR